MSKPRKHSKKKNKKKKFGVLSTKSSVMEFSHMDADSLSQSIEFDFSGANTEQQEAIKSTDGPVLITAGPGTGKTFTLVQRALYLIMKKGIKPEQILMATFTEKAAKELVTRISNKLAENNIPININEMYIGTFHSICVKILRRYIDYIAMKLD